MTRGRWIGLVALGVGLYALFLIVFAPADYLARYAAPMTRNAVALQNAGGTLWRGHALVISPQTGPQAVGELRWQLYPLRLITGTLAAELTFTGDGINAHGVVDATRQRHRLRDVTLTAPIEIVSLFYPVADVLGLSGEVQLVTSTLELDKEALRGNADIVWRNAASRMLPVTQTGEYRLQIVAQGKRATLNLSTVEGPLQVSGQGEWRVLEDGALRLQGTVTPSTSTPALEPVLNAIGPAQANGARTFNVEMRLRPIDTSLLFP